MTGLTKDRVDKRQWNKLESRRIDTLRLPLLQNLPEIDIMHANISKHIYSFEISFNYIFGVKFGIIYL